jgi:hypothetical protein
MFLDIPSLIPNILTFVLRVMGKSPTVWYALSTKLAAG